MRQPMLRAVLSIASRSRTSAATTGAACRSTSVMAFTREIPLQVMEMTRCLRSKAWPARRWASVTAASAWLIEARASGRLPSVAVGEGGEPRRDGLGRGRQGLPAVALAPAGESALPAAIGLAGALGERLGHVVLGPLDEGLGQRDLAAVGRQRDQRS